MQLFLRDPSYTDRLAAFLTSVGRRAVVVGAEHVSFSALPTLAHGGARTVAMVTAHARHQSHPALVWATAGWRRFSRSITKPVMSKLA